MSAQHDLPGRYRMLRRLAGGGMGEVYLAAVDGPVGFHKLAVVKRILPHLAHDPEFVAMFVNEARIAASLDHPNIVRVYDFGHVEGSFFYAMEYLHGDSLAGILPRLAGSKQRMPLQHALAIGLGTCAGLHFAHERRGPRGESLAIVHRDVSPANVFVTHEGEVKILDFGLAKVLSSSDVTQAGIRKGKAAYMSPEQCIGAPLDRRSDVFAIGILLYEMTTMTRLFRADNEFAAMNMITSSAIPPPSSRVPDYPPALAAVVLRALERDPERRHASALELYEDLERVVVDLDLRPSSLALGRFVRDLTGDKPYPSVEAHPADEPKTAVFFAAVNRTTSDRRRVAPRDSPPYRGRPLVAAAVLGLVLVLVITWRSLPGPLRSSKEGEPAAPAVALEPVAGELAAPAVAPEPAPPEPPLDPPLAHAEDGDDVLPEASPGSDTRPAPRPRGGKKPATAIKKTNVLDSLRPSK